MSDKGAKAVEATQRIRAAGVYVAKRFRGLLGVVSFGVAAAVLAWLAAAITLFLSLPLWVSITTAAVALGVGIAHAANFRLVPSLAVAICIVIVSCTSFAIGYIGSDSANGAGHTPLIPVLGGVRASLEVKNKTYGKTWGRTIEAAGNDELQFRFVVKNPSASPSNPLVMRILVRETYGEPQEVDICFARSESGPYEEGPIVKIVPQDNGLGEYFSASSPQEGFPSPVASHLTSLGGQSWTAQGADFNAEDFTVPALSTHQRLVITFGGSFVAPDSAQIDGGSLDLKNLTDGQDEYESVTAARPGDVIQAYYGFHNSGFRAAQVFTRVRITSHDKGLFHWVSVYVRENGEPERYLGRGVINATADEPIEVGVLSGATELRAADTECSEETRHPLPDGVTTGGLDLGSIGGYEPRDPCLSAEFDRYLFFKLRATAVRASAPPSS